MTTDEFKREIEKLGLIFVDVGVNSPRYFVESEKGSMYAEVSYVREYEMKIYGGTLEKRKKLFQILAEYTSTPITEREPKRYFQYRALFFKDTSLVGWLNYNRDLKYFSVDTRYIDELERFQTIFEENDPLLNDVNLEVFEAIEVDKDGNEVEIDETE